MWSFLKFACHYYCDITVIFHCNYCFIFDQAIAATISGQYTVTNIGQYADFFYKIAPTLSISFLEAIDERQLEDSCSVFQNSTYTLIYIGCILIKSMDSLQSEVQHDSVASAVACACLTLAKANKPPPTLKLWSLFKNKITGGTTSPILPKMW